MEKLEKQVIVYVDKEMYSWLDVKAAKGYKKAALIRRLIQDRMDFENRLNRDGAVV